MFTPTPSPSHHVCLYLLSLYYVYSVSVAYQLLCCQWHVCSQAFDFQEKRFAWLLLKAPLQILPGIWNDNIMLQLTKTNLKILVIILFVMIRWDGRFIQSSIYITSIILDM